MGAGRTGPIGKGLAESAPIKALLPPEKKYLFLDEGWKYTINTVVADAQA